MELNKLPPVLKFKDLIYELSKDPANNVAKLADFSGLNVHHVKDLLNENVY